MRLALFDLDNTLLTGDSDEEWFNFLAASGHIDAAVETAKNEEMMRRYRDGSADTLAFIEFYLRLLTLHDVPTLEAWRAEYLAKHIHPRIPQAARDLLAEHAADLVVIVTATNRFLTTPIAAELGVEHLVATDPEMREGRYTGKCLGVPSFREGKIARITDWLAARGTRLEDYAEIWFYSDSINDLPLLERVTHPVVVDPDPKLAAVAAERGWQRRNIHGTRTV